MSPARIHHFAVAFFLLGCALLGASLAHVARHLKLLPKDALAVVTAGVPAAAPVATSPSPAESAAAAEADPEPAPSSQPQGLAAKQPVDVFTLSRTPIAVVGRMRYQVLGLGQDEATGEQVVWLRSLGSNRISGFAEGAAVFGGPARVERISASHVGFRHEGKVVRVDLEVD